MWKVIFRCSLLGACLPADPYRTQDGMFWETGSCRGPGPARQLHRMSTAFAQHRAHGRADTAMMRLTWAYSLSSRYTVTAHGVRARQDQDDVILLVTRWAAGELLQTVHVFFCILLLVGLSCLHIQQLLLPVSSPGIKGPHWHYWQLNNFFKHHWVFDFLISFLVKKISKGNLTFP